MDGPVAISTVNGNGLLDTVAATTIDPQQLVTYLSNVLQALFGATEHDLRSSHSLLGTQRRGDTLQRCSRFAQEAQAAALYIYKIRETSLPHDDEDDAGTNGVTGMHRYQRRSGVLLTRIS